MERGTPWSLCRDHLLNYGQTGGSRFGDLSLRQQRLTLPMLNVLQVEDVRVQLSICTYNDAKEPTNVDNSGASYFPPLDEFVYLHTKVTNLSCQ